MARKKPDPRRNWLFFAAAAAMLLAIVILVGQISKTRQRYDTLAAQTPQPTLAPPSLQFRPTEILFRKGSIGPEVVELQRRLNELGYYEGELDGKYYEGTAAAVILFQAQHGLEADGIAGALTLAILNSSQAQRKLDITPSPFVSIAPNTESPVPTKEN